MGRTPSNEALNATLAFGKRWPVGVPAFGLEGARESEYLPAACSAAAERLACDLVGGSTPHPPRVEPTPSHPIWSMLRGNRCRRSTEHAHHGGSCAGLSAIALFAQARQPAVARRHRRSAQGGRDGRLRDVPLGRRAVLLPRQQLTLLPEVRFHADTGPSGGRPNAGIVTTSKEVIVGARVDLGCLRHVTLALVKPPIGRNCFWPPSAAWQIMFEYLTAILRARSHHTAANSCCSHGDESATR